MVHPFNAIPPVFGKHIHVLQFSYPTSKQAHPNYCCPHEFMHFLLFWEDHLDGKQAVWFPFSGQSTRSEVIFWGFEAPPPLGLGKPFAGNQGLQSNGQAPGPRGAVQPLLVFAPHQDPDTRRGARIPPGHFRASWARNLSQNGGNPEMVVFLLVSLSNHSKKGILKKRPTHLATSFIQGMCVRVLVETPFGYHWGGDSCPPDLVDLV